jgi:hypothetical protein
MLSGKHLQPDQCRANVTLIKITFDLFLTVHPRTLLRQPKFCRISPEVGFVVAGLTEILRAQSSNVMILPYSFCALYEQSESFPIVPQVFQICKFSTT